MNKKVGLVGRKVGMTRIFTDVGLSIPVTVLDVSDNKVTQVKTPEIDVYCAVQLAFAEKKASRVSRPEMGHFAKAGVAAQYKLVEFRLDAPTDLTLGSSVVLNSIFSEGQLVDVTGTTKGKGFSGGIKRHNFSSNRASHGNSLSHRTVGSIGQAQDPGRVFPGKKMPGHYGADKRTVQNLEIARIDDARQLLFIKGAVPGPINGYIVVKPAIKDHKGM